MPPAGENAAFYRARIGRLLHFEFQSRLHKVQHKTWTREPAPVFCAAYVGVFFCPKNTIESLHAVLTRDDLSRRKRAFAAAMRRNHTVSIEVWNYLWDGLRSRRKPLRRGRMYLNLSHQQLAVEIAACPMIALRMACAWYLQILFGKRPKPAATCRAKKAKNGTIEKSQQK